MLGKQFGAKANPTLVNRYSKSSNWDGKKFVNQAETTMDISLRTLPKLFYQQFFKRKEREPSKPIRVESYEVDEFLAPSDRMKFVWFGHSALLLRIKNLTLLIDPMFGPNAAPISPFPVKRFSDNTLGLIEKLPPIDLMLLSHDHYDHLDLASIKRLQSKVAKFYVAIGTGRHLEKWGIDGSLITEFDWWDSHSFGAIDITFTPSRHFSGRGLSDRAKSLWGGWAFKTAQESIYFSGDGGYGEHFKEVGDRLGPFDFGFIECGQYHEYWHQIHMYPEESVQAAIDAKVQKVMAVHWGGFALALHTWKDPIERFTAAADKKEVPQTHPRVGSMTSYTDDKKDMWWQELS